MNDIIMTHRPGTLTSIEAVGMADKDHGHLMRDIRKYARQLNEAKIELTDFLSNHRIINKFFRE